ncbi:MAG: tail assembly protein [Pseudomonadota bacterium]
MIRDIFLHGALGQRFERHIRLDVVSPAEAVRALSMMLPGFNDHVEARSYQVFRGCAEDGVSLTPQDLHIRFADTETELHIVPEASGAKRGGFAKVITGALLIAASFAIPGAGAFLGGALPRIGASMIFGGIAQAFSPQGNTNYEDREQPTSDLFTGPVNVSTPGAPVPVLFGECEVGSVVISAAIHVEDRASDEVTNEA